MKKLIIILTAIGYSAMNGQTPIVFPAIDGGLQSAGSNGISFYDNELNVKNNSNLYVGYRNTANTILQMNGGNVGIGTASPYTKFDVLGTIGLYGTGLDGSAYQRTVIYSDINNGLYFDAPKKPDGSGLPINFSWRGSTGPKMTILPSGKVNIPGVYNFEQLNLGQFGNGSCGLEFVNHTNISSSYGIKIKANVDEGIAGLQIQTANITTDYENLIYSTRFAIDLDGNIGIGTKNPSTKLNIKQDGGGWNDGIRINLDSHSWDIVSDTYGERLLICRDQNDNQGIAILNGNVGIGTDLSSNPNNYKLAVNGTIGAKEVKIEITSATWSDFIFNPEYNLRTLHETEQFIKENGHLPDIPSAKEVEEEGISLGEMDAKLLQKIEELTLYMIELKKEKDEEIAALKSEIKLLKNKK